MALRRIRLDQPDRDARLAELCRRTTTAAPEVESTVAAIVADVRARGDAAVRDYTERFEQRAPQPGRHRGGGYELAVTGDQPIAGPVRAALERAAARIRDFHRRQREAGYRIDDGGAVLELRVEPLRRVGIYVPGGTAAYPSSVLMNAIPAQVAGVGEIVMVCPRVDPVVHAAAAIGGVHRLFEIGGAQAVAALAFGTATVPRVDKIVGPGNQWVATAKRLVFGEVDIDSIAGPSEVMIIADGDADPRLVAADLLAQAEHDVEARPILVTTSAALATAVDGELDRQLAALPRRDIAGASLARWGVAVEVADLDAAVALAGDYAPEHLELLVADPRALSGRVRGAGAVFVGPWTPEAAGDYLAGPNHVLPTGGAARYASPLGVYDFVKRTSVLELDRAALAAMAGDITALAEVEGLDAHARSVTARIDGEGE